MTASTTIGRPRLRARLEAEQTHRVTMVVAPAGYGKSILLREFAASAGKERLVLYRVRSSHRSPIGFARGVSDALADALVVPPLHEYIYANGARDPSGLRDWLVHVLAAFDGTIAIDDLHLATGDEDCGKFVASIIEETPPHVHWLLATRSIANVPLASWQSNGEAGDPLGEADLSLTANESMRLSRASGLALSDQIIDHLAGLTRGWPAAFAFGIRLAAKGVAAAGVVTYTRAFVDDLFAEQVLSVLAPAEREVLLDTSLLSRVEPAALGERYGFDVEAMLNALRRDVAFVGLDPRGGFVYHDLLREFLRREIRKAPAAEVEARVRWACGVLVDAAEPDAALDLSIDMETFDSALAVLERVGFRLLDGGYFDVVDRAVRRLEAHAHGHPVVVGIAASLEALHGNYVRAEELFARAIERAAGDLAGELRIRLASHRLHLRDDEGASAAIAECDFTRGAAHVRLSLLTVAACIDARDGRTARARERLNAAVGLLPALNDEAHVAVAHHEVAVVLYLLGSFERARSYATSAVQIGERLRIAGVAGRARSVLSAIAGELGNTGVQRQINHDLRTLARGARDPKLLFFALANLFVIEIEAGHLAAARTVEVELHQFDATLFRDSEEALYPAYALRAAWEGEFGVAYSYLRGTDARLSPETRRILRRCEIALYAAASGDPSESRAVAENAAAAFARWDGDPRALHSRALTARILLALAYALLDEYRAAFGLLDSLHYATAVQRRAFDRFAQAARAFIRARSSGDDNMAVSLARLRDSDLGGYALLIQSLADVPALRAFGEAPSALTAAERAVLERLSRGLTSKEIAAAFGKSRYTIDTQVKSIVRKFGCSGRGEAVYLARRYGILD